MWRLLRAPSAPLSSQPDARAEGRPHRCAELRYAVSGLHTRNGKLSPVTDTIWWKKRYSRNAASPIITDSTVQKKKRVRRGLVSRQNIERGQGGERDCFAYRLYGKPGAPLLPCPFAPLLHSGSAAK